MGILYIVTTPIGNLKDITLRAIEVLSSTHIIACEDTRRTGLLFQELKIGRKDKMLVSYYEENELGRIPQIINALKNGENIALVSDAGTPTISDPGFKLVRECIQQGIKVEAIPGVSAVITALTVSGLPTDKFLFIGYLPKKSGKREKMLEEIKKNQQNVDQLSATIILYETPHRIVQTLKEIHTIFGDIQIVIARELTKLHEEQRRELISETLTHFKKTSPKGEFVLLFNLSNKV